MQLSLYTLSDSVGLTLFIIAYYGLLLYLCCRLLMFDFDFSFSFSSVSCSPPALVAQLQ